MFKQKRLNMGRQLSTATLVQKRSSQLGQRSSLCIATSVIPNADYDRSKQKQPEDVEYFNCSGSMMTRAARCTCDINYRIGIAKATLSKKKTLYQQIELNVRKNLVS
jgi:hypothetical protein